MNKDLHTYIIMHNVFGDQDEYFEHFGAKGMHWGQRRWQNEDGSLTPAGRVHYGYGSERKSGSDDDRVHYSTQGMHWGNVESKRPSGWTMDTPHNKQVTAKRVATGIATVVGTAGAVATGLFAPAGIIAGAGLVADLALRNDYRVVQTEESQKSFDDAKKQLGTDLDTPMSSFSEYYSYDSKTGEYSEPKVSSDSDKHYQAQLKLYDEVADHISKMRDEPLSSLLTEDMLSAAKRRSMEEEVEVAERDAKYAKAMEIVKTDPAAAMKKANLPETYDDQESVDAQLSAVIMNKISAEYGDWYFSEPKTMQAARDFDEYDRSENDREKRAESKRTICVNALKELGWEVTPDNIKEIESFIFWD